MKNVFPKKNKIGVLVSVVILLVALVLTFTGKGLRGEMSSLEGMILTYDIKEDFAVNEVIKMIDKQELTAYQVAKKGTGLQQLEIHLPKMQESDLDAFTATFEKMLVEKYTQADVEHASIRSIGAVTGKNLGLKSVIALVVSALLVLSYFALRYGFGGAVAALVTLLHNVLMALSAMVIFHNFAPVYGFFPVTLVTVAGYGA
ncbi:MAG: hypothetical protein GX786_09420, partial [Clostridiales bacterium]|nr:hypothetical protein [Clostridiales bacterium]